MTPDAVPQHAPLHLDLKKDAALTVKWADGAQTVYPLDFLRAHCPCAACRERRRTAVESPAKVGKVEKVVKRPAGPLSLTVLPAGAGDGPLTVRSAELVGNYALRLDWSDGHASGIYSFKLLRDLAANLS